MYSYICTYRFLLLLSGMYVTKLLFFNQNLIVTKIILLCLTWISDTFFIWLTVDGSWGSWGQWGTCTVTCGGGRWSRSRTCDNPAPANGGLDCPGSMSDFGDCSTSDCPTVAPGQYQQVIFIPRMRILCMNWSIFNNKSNLHENYYDWCWVDYISDLSRRLLFLSKRNYNLHPRTVQMRLFQRLWRRKWRTGSIRRMFIYPYC